MGALSWRSVFQKPVTRRITASLIATAMVILVLAGCSSGSDSGEETPSPDPTSTPVPASTPEPTSEPVPTEASTPTVVADEAAAQPTTTDNDEETSADAEPTPRPESGQDIEWVSYENAEHGYSLKHPAGWSVGPPMYGRLFIANEELDCGSCRIIPPGTVMMTITPGAEPPQRSGEPVRLGGFYHGEFFYGGVSGAMDPDRVFEIHYQAAQIEWRIYAFFGDPINTDNQLRDQVFELIHSIEHDATTPPTAPQAASTYELVDTWTGLNRPTGIAVDSTGDVYIADTGNHRVVKVTPNGEPIFQITHNSQGAPLNTPVGVGVGDSEGTGFVYIAEAGRTWINHYLIVDEHDAEDGPTGAPLSGWGWDSQRLFYPLGVTVNPDGLGGVYAAVGGSIARFSLLGDFQSEIHVGGELWGLALGIDAQILAADRHNERIVKVGWNDEVVGEWYGFDEPADVAVDAMGYIYVAEAGSNRVVRLSPEGVFLDEVGGPDQFDSPRGVAVDERGRVYVSDNTSIQVFVPPWAE